MGEYLIRERCVSGRDLVVEADDEDAAWAKYEAGGVFRTLDCGDECEEWCESQSIRLDAPISGPAREEG